jgi:hypothetical protein
MKIINVSLVAQRFSNSLLIARCMLYVCSRARHYIAYTWRVVGVWDRAHVRWVYVALSNADLEGMVYATEGVSWAGLMVLVT